jgi:hypothetical protein
MTQSLRPRRESKYCLDQCPSTEMILLSGLSAMGHHPTTIFQGLRDKTRIYASTGPVSRVAKPTLVYVMARFGARGHFPC